MRETADELLEEFNQGVIRIARVTKTATPGRPWDKTNGAPSYTTVSGVVRTVEEMYVDGTLVRGHERQATIQDPRMSPEPSLEDMIEVDGRLCKPIKRIRIPDSGQVVCYKFVLAD